MLGGWGVRLGGDRGSQMCSCVSLPSCTILGCLVPAQFTGFRQLRVPINRLFLTLMRAPGCYMKIMRPLAGAPGASPPSEASRPVPGEEGSQPWAGKTQGRARVKGKGGGRGGHQRRNNHPEMERGLL